MDLYALATQLGTALAPVTPALRRYPYGTLKIEAPAAVIALPSTLEYHGAYGLGQSTISDLPVLIMVRDNERRASHKALADYCRPTGVGSVKAALEGGTYTACDTVTVARVDFDVLTMAGLDYLTALFHLDIVGTGS